MRIMKLMKTAMTSKTAIYDISRLALRSIVTALASDAEGQGNDANFNTALDIVSDLGGIRSWSVF